MAQIDQPVNQPAAIEPEVNIDTEENPEIVNKYAVPQSVFFLKEKRYVPINELQNLIIAKDSRDKMTLKALVMAKDGKLYKTSTYLGLKAEFKKERAPRKKRAPKTDAAKKAAEDSAAEVKA